MMGDDDDKNRSLYDNHNNHNWHLLSGRTNLKRSVQLPANISQKNAITANGEPNQQIAQTQNQPTNIPKKKKKSDREA